MNPATLQGGSNGGPGGPQNANMYNQLESMMMAVKKEAEGLEKLKSKLRDMDDLKRRNSDLKEKLQASESANSDLHRMLETAEKESEAQREDMQSLNDMYNDERTRHLEVQQRFLTQEQELMHLKGEAETDKRELAKIGQLRQSHQKTLGQLASTQKKLEDSHEDWARATKAFEERIRSTEADKENVSKHVWNLTEEIRGLRSDVEHARLEKDALQEALGSSEQRTKQAKELCIMITEDGLSHRFRNGEARSKQNSLIVDLQKQIAGLETLVERKDENMQMLNDKLNSFHKARNSEKEEVRNKVNELMDALGGSRSTVSHLEQQCTLARERELTATRLLEEKETEVENLTITLSTVNSQLNSREKELESALKLRSDAQSKLQDHNNHFEAMQNQIRDGQTKYWDELRKMKEKEVELTAEIESLSSSLEDRRGEIRILEKEKSEQVKLIEEESTRTAEMATNLRKDLEARTDELTSIRKERDALRAERDTLEEKAKNSEKIIQKNEMMYQKALESDRSKIQHEIRVKLGRMKGMEEEKQELLKELEELMSQLGASRKEISRLKVELESTKRSLQDLEIQYTSVATDKDELQSEIRIAQRKEQELRDQAARLDTQFRADVAKLETMVKESKKNAAAQVTEISNRVKATMDDAENIRKERDNLLEAERVAKGETEKVRTELTLVKQAHDEMQLKMAGEGANLKREITELRSRMKIMQESKSKTDTEAMEVRLDQTRLENECARLKESLKDAENRVSAKEQEVEGTRSELIRVTDLYKAHKVKLVDLEQKELHHQKAMGKVMEESARVENTTKMELRRMRVVVQNAESESDESRKMIPRLQKEAIEAKAAAQQARKKCDAEIADLLEQLQKAEESLSYERRKAQQQVEQYHSRVVELQSSLEKTKGSMEEDLYKTKTEASNKEQRNMMLESDLTRTQLAHKEAESRIGDLERQRQSERAKLMEIKEALATAESSLHSTRTELELERAQRERVEGRLRALQAATDSHGEFDTNLDDYDNIGSVPSMSHSGGSSAATTTSDSHYDRSYAESSPSAIHSLGESKNKSPSSGRDYTIDPKGYLRQGLNEAFNATNIDESSTSTSKSMTNTQESTSAPRKTYNDDILAAMPSPPRAGQVGSDFLKQYDHAYASSDLHPSSDTTSDVTANTLPSQDDVEAGRDAVVDRVTAALSARLGRNSATIDSDNVSAHVSGLRDAVEEAQFDITHHEVNVDEDSVDIEDDDDSVQQSIRRTQRFLKNRMTARTNSRESENNENNINGKLEEMDVDATGTANYRRPGPSEIADPKDVYGATYLYNDENEGGATHWGPVRDEPDFDRLHRGDTRDGGGLGVGFGIDSTDKDAILFGAPNLQPASPPRGSGYGDDTHTTDDLQTSPVNGFGASSPSQIMAKRSKAKGKIKKMQVSMNSKDAPEETNNGKKRKDSSGIQLPRIAR